MLVYWILKLPSENMSKLKWNHYVVAILFGEIVFDMSSSSRSIGVASFFLPFAQLLGKNL